MGACDGQTHHTRTGHRPRLPGRGHGGATLIKEARLNDDGRCAEPLLQGAALIAGRYRLLFALADPPFLDQVPLDFGVADIEAHYHVPLLASPWSYATYRGS